MPIWCKVFLQTITYEKNNFISFVLCKTINSLIKETNQMRAKLITVLLIMLLAVTGCSSGSKSNTPEDKIATINSMLSKGYEMSDNQLKNVNKAIEEAKELIAQNKVDEANALLKKTINTMELIAETDRFNKSE